MRIPKTRADSIWLYFFHSPNTQHYGNDTLKSMVKFYFVKKWNSIFNPSNAQKIDLFLKFAIKSRSICNIWMQINSQHRQTCRYVCRKEGEERKKKWQMTNNVRYEPHYCRWQVELKEKYDFTSYGACSAMFIRIKLQTLTVMPSGAWLTIDARRFCTLVALQQASWIIQGIHSPIVKTKQKIKFVFLSFPNV